MGRISYYEMIPYMSPVYMAADEHHHQVAFFEILKKQFPQLREVSFAIPNGGSRNKVEAVNMKLEGVTPGIPDVMIAWPVYPVHGLFLEFKSMKKEARPSPEQIQRLNALRSAGYIALVVHGVEQALEAMRIYLENGMLPLSRTPTGIDYPSQVNGKYSHEYWLIS